MADNVLGSTPRLFDLAMKTPWGKQNTPITCTSSCPWPSITKEPVAFATQLVDQIGSYIYGSYINESIKASPCMVRLSLQIHFFEMQCYDLKLLTD
jgi:hypothetical protein